MTTEEKNIPAETADENGGEGKVSESLYKELLNEKTEKETELEQLRRENEEKDKALEKAQFTAQKLRREKKEALENMNSPDEQVETPDIKTLIKETLNEYRQEETMQQSKGKLQTLLGGVEDPYRRQAIEQELSMVNSNDPETAFETASLIVDAKLQKLANGKDGNANPEKVSTPGSVSRKETVPSIVEMARKEFGLDN